MWYGNGTNVKDQYDTARIVFYTQEIISMCFAAILVLALRSAPRIQSFTDERVKAKATFRLVLFFIGIGDMFQTSSVVFYIADYFSSNGCVVAAFISSTGTLISSVFTACLSIEGYLIISKGLRDGERTRAVAYVTFTILFVSTIQILSGLEWGFGAAKTEKSGEYTWCHLQIKNPVSEIVSFYGPISLCFIICLICYFSMECKLRKILKNQGMNDAIRNTLNRSRMKFLAFPLIFVCSWIPTAIHRIVIRPNSPLNTGHWFLLYFSGLTAEGLPIWNTLFFCFFNPEARESLKTLWCYRCCLGKSGDSNRVNVIKDTAEIRNDNDSFGSSEPGWDERQLLGESFTDDNVHDEDISLGFSMNFQDDAHSHDTDDLPPSFLYNQDD
jgi:hypothetical protein